MSKAGGHRPPLQRRQYPAVMAKVGFRRAILGFVHLHHSASADGGGFSLNDFQRKHTVVKALFQPLPQIEWGRSSLVGHDDRPSRVQLAWETRLSPSGA